MFDDLRAGPGAEPETLFGLANFPNQPNALGSTGGLAMGSYVIRTQLSLNSSFAVSDIGATHIHEIGHCLGLYHTFEGEGSDEVPAENPEVCNICGDHAGTSSNFKGKFLLRSDLISQAI